MTAKEDRATADARKPLRAPCKEFHGFQLVTRYGLFAGPRTNSAAKTLWPNRTSHRNFSNYLRQPDQPEFSTATLQPIRRLDGVSQALFETCAVRATISGPSIAAKFIEQCCCRLRLIQSRRQSSQR